MISATQPVFRLPDLGEGLPDAELLEWHVAVGDSVKTDQLLLTVETAKAVVEVPCPQDGVIKSLHAVPGDLVKTGAPLVEFSVPETVKAAAKQSQKNSQSNNPGMESSQGNTRGKGTLKDFEPEKREDSGTVVGHLKASEHLGDTDSFFIGLSPSTQVWLDAQKATQAHNGSLQTGSHQTGSHQTGSHQTGSHKTGSPRTRSSPPLSSTPMPEGATPLRGVRRQMAASLSKANAEVVPVTLMETVDIHAWPKGSDPTLRLVNAIIAGCRISPNLNAWAGGEPLAVKIIESIDLGIAVDTDQGLFVPILRNIQNRTSADLRSGINRLRQDVESRKIPPAELIGATITLSNYGTMAGKFGTPVVVPPQVAIVGAGVIREEAVAYKGKVAVHKVLPISLTFDHRLATGGEAARFLKAMVEDLVLASTGDRHHKHSAGDSGVQPSGSKSDRQRIG